MITRETVADKIASYLHHDSTLDQLVNWAENALIDETFAESDASLISRVLARIGVADVRAFDLTWDECQELLHELGFAARVDVIAV
ncbi:MAG TPA: hypothetical protein VG537_07765 [Candidatus Kapabacteria bacterium]|nr:hypothetical protein [Candidatus Kapabacteria bacterium]